MNALDALATRLQTQGVGIKGVTIFTGSDADLPTLTQTGPAIISIMQTGGVRRVRIHGQGPSGAIHGPHFQIVARHPRYPNAEALCYSALAEIEMENTLIADVFFLHVVPMQDPFELGKDQLGNPRVAFNVETSWRR